MTFTKQVNIRGSIRDILSGETDNWVRRSINDFKCEHRGYVIDKIPFIALQPTPASISLRDTIYINIFYK